MDLAERVTQIDKVLKQDGHGTTLSTNEVCKVLGNHPKTVQAYVRDKRIKASRVGKNYRYLREEVARFMAYSEDSD